MLLLFSSGTTGTLAVGVSDTLSLSVTEDPTSDFFIETLDDLRISVADSGQPIVRVDRSDFLNLSLAESAGTAISGVVAVAATDTLSLSIDDAAIAAVVAVTQDVTDTLSLTIDDVSTVDIGQIAVDVADDLSISIGDFAFRSTVADVSRVSADDLSLRLEDSAQVIASQPVAAIRFVLQPDKIRFSSP